MTVASDEATRARVRDAIEADPAVSNRAIAKALRIGRDTVNDVRRTMKGNNEMGLQVVRENSAVVRVAALPAGIDASHARLPEVYQGAIVALTKVMEIDECRDWANKAEALASYARQMNDDRLYDMSKRIQARATRRCGELLTRVQTGAGRPTKISTGDGTNYSRKKAATDAGMSKRQKVTALRVAAVPEADFERQVESDSPPTVTALAEQGKGLVAPTRAKTTRAPRKLNVDRLCEELVRFAGFCEANKRAPDAVAQVTHPHVIADIRKNAAVIGAWLDRIVVNLADS